MIFSDNPCLERQRDFFIFQSLIGCRIGDLYGFTKANIVNIFPTKRFYFSKPPKNSTI